MVGPNGYRPLPPVSRYIFISSTIKFLALATTILFFWAITINHASAQTIEQKTCHKAIQSGEVALNSQGNTNWDVPDAAAFCRDIVNFSEKKSCFQARIAQGFYLNEALDLCKPAGMLRTKMPQNYQLPLGSLVYEDGSAMLPDGHRLSKTEARTGIKLLLRDNSKCAGGDISDFLRPHLAQIESKDYLRAHSRFCFVYQGDEIEYVVKRVYAETPALAEKKALEECKVSQAGVLETKLIQECHPILLTEFVGQLPTVFVHLENNISKYANPNVCGANHLEIDFIKTLAEADGSEPFVANYCTEFTGGYYWRTMTGKTLEIAKRTAEVACIQRQNTNPANRGVLAMRCKLMMYAGPSDKLHPPKIKAVIPTSLTVEKTSGITLKGKIWDFSSTHPDFHTRTQTIGLAGGAVAPALADDGRPVLISPYSGTFTSEENFAQWYRDVPGVNRSRSQKIELMLDENGNLIYETQNYFPIDGELLGNEGNQFRDEEDIAHNFHFTTWLTGEFSFTDNSDRFAISGNGDAWVFFDGKLGIDKGGIHASRTGSISGERLRGRGLKPGAIYKIDIFHAERTPKKSSFKIETNFDLHDIDNPKLPSGPYAGFSYLKPHFASLADIEMNACGTKQGGFDGFGDYEVPANSYGNGHIFTPDGLVYDFQAGGEYTLLAASDESVLVHARKAAHEGEPAAMINTAVAIKVNRDVVELYSDKKGQRLYINGEATRLPDDNIQLSSGGVIVPDGMGQTGPRYLIAFPRPDFALRVNLYHGFLDVGAQYYREAASDNVSYTGVIGNLDGNPQNDLLPRNAKELICPAANLDEITSFGESWRLSPAETLLRSELGNNFVPRATERKTGIMVSVERAVFNALEQQFARVEPQKLVNISTLIPLVQELYDVEEAILRQSLATIFNQDALISAERFNLGVQTIIDYLQAYKKTMSVPRIGDIEMDLRAQAQQFCETVGLRDAQALLNCTFDVATMGDENIAQSALMFQDVVQKLPAKRRFAGSLAADMLNSKLVLDDDALRRIAGKMAMEDGDGHSSCTAHSGKNTLPPLTFSSEKMHPFSNDGLEVDGPDVGEFLFVRSADEQVVIHARRELLRGEDTKPVITAMHFVIGKDKIEFLTVPTSLILVNGKRVNRNNLPIKLPDGGMLSAAEGDDGTVLINWPCTSFAAEIHFSGFMHLVPSFRPDPNMSYDGLVRFTEKYLLRPEQSPFSTAVSN